MGSSGAGAEQGVLFPAGPDGRRSSGVTGQAVWAQAAAATDPDLARRVSGQADWRSGYLNAVVAHTAAAARSAQASLQIARDGLAALAGRMVLVRDGGTAPLADGLPEPAAPLLATTLRGQGERVRELVVPYRGQELRGDGLRRQVDAWTDRGVLEPSCAGALHAVLDAPDQLDLSDRAFALLGAGAELGPLGPLSQWGAHVVAVDVPSTRVWDRVRATAAAGSGTLTCPGGPQPGVDLLTRAPEVAAFLRTAAAGLPMTVGSYAYADGARHVQLAAASDAVVARLLGERPGAGYAELATPTDAFAVPEPVVAEARRRFRARGASALVQRPLQAAGLYRPSYAADHRRDDGAVFGVADVLVPQQGPNYTLAKRVQRWRAVVAQADGHPVSANVAPATRTRSVLSNRLLAAAYAGARRFGVEVFDPAASRVLMAALLVHDLRTAAPAPAYPEDLFVQGAAHGGLWRIGYQPRSVLPLAALAGLPAAARRR